MRIAYEGHQQELAQLESTYEEEKKGFLKEFEATVNEIKADFDVQLKTAN
jgi:hypothetical protein